MKTTPKQHTLELLHAMLSEEADFRPGQWEAIEAVAIQKKRALVVQRTGWGKSLVYSNDYLVFRQTSSLLSCLIFIRVLGLLC